MNNKLVHEVGINDADYVVQPTIAGKRITCPFYRVWKHMLERCYCEKYQTKKPTYKDCSVCEEWLTFSNFKTWMEKQDWKGKQLDKDILGFDNKQYNAACCVFISSEINSLLTDCANKRGKYPLGVSWHKRVGKFNSRTCIKGKQKHLGYFITSKDAHREWQILKKDVIYNLVLLQIDERIKSALLLRCNQLQHDIDNELETIKL